MIDYIVAAAVPDDLVEIKTLLNAHGLPSQDLTVSKLKTFLVARDPESSPSSSSDIVGVVGLETFKANNDGGDGNVALLRSLVVKEAYKNQGIAKSLCDEMESMARVHHGIRQVYLLTTTAEDYFCDKRGFQRISRENVPASVQSTTEFSGGLCPCSAVCLTKNLE